MGDTLRFGCPSCPKTFARVDHLKRHKRAHNANRPHKCAYCGKSYARLDVLKRHYQSCTDGLLQPASLHKATSSEPSQRKTRRNSSELFSRFRVTASSNDETTKAYNDVQRATESGLPTPRYDDALELGPTDARKQDATDNDASNLPLTSPRSDTMNPDEALLSLSGNMVSVEMLLVSQDPVVSFSFLLRFTSGVEFTQAFDDPSPSFASLDLATTQDTSSGTAFSDTLTHAATPDRAAEYERAVRNNSWPECETTHVGCVSYSTAMTLLPSCLDANSLIGKCLDILTDLKHYRPMAHPGECPGTWSVEAVAAQYFSPARLLSLLDYYWSGWHPNLPILNRPLFSVLSAPSALLAAMAIIGARYSPCKRDQEQSKILYREVEELVFNNLSTVASYSTDSPHSQRLRVQALQAAYLVVVCQNWDGRAADRPKVRRQRFSHMIEAMQFIGIGKAKHRDYRCAAAGEFDWLQYVENEELIRLFNWCFLVDAAFVTFYNLAPRLGLRELRMGLPSPEACFEAASAETCLFELQRWQYQTNFDADTTLYDTLKTFCRAEMDFAMQIRFAHQSTITLFCIASAFHVMLFNCDPDMGPVSQYDPLLTAIGNWRAVWNRKTFLSGEMFSSSSMPFNTKSGFWNHCPEYWLLAYVLVQQIIKYKNSGSKALCKTAASRLRCTEYDEASQSKLHAFIQSYTSGNVIG